MKLRHRSVGAALTLAAAGSFAAIPVAAASAGASITKVSIKMVTPDTITTQGAFKMQVSGTGAFASFDIYWRATGLSSTYTLLKSKVNGKTWNQVVAPNTDGDITYEMVPWSGTNDTGSKGPAAYSATFKSEAESAWSYSCYLDNGPGGEVTGKYFSGTAIELTGVGAYMTCYGYGQDFNDALVIGVASNGGTAEVYVNGSSKGSPLSFKSSKANGFLINFKYGTGTPQYNDFKIVDTGGNDWVSGVTSLSCIYSVSC